MIYQLFPARKIATSRLMGCVGEYLLSPIFQRTRVETRFVTFWRHGRSKLALKPIK
jgi:hypothetical protein